MKICNINQFRKSGLWSFALLFVFILSCSDETETIQKNGESQKEAFRAIKYSATSEVSTEDLSILRKSANDGSAMGKVTMKFPEWGITEEYSFWVISKRGYVFGRFDYEDFVNETGEVFDHTWGLVTCVTFEDDGKTARLSGEVTGGVNHPDGVLPEDHYARFTVVDNKFKPDQATPIFSGQPQDYSNYHCTIGIPIDDPSWWGTFREVEGKIKVISKDCKVKHKD